MGVLQVGYPCRKVTAESSAPRQSTPLATLSYKGTLLIRNCPPPCDRHRALGILLLEDAKGALFLVSEVPLYHRLRCEWPAVERKGDTCRSRRG